MPKFYVKSGKCKVVRNADSAISAALKSVSTWKAQKRKMEPSVRVSEVGFEGDHPHHGDDPVFAMNFIKKKLAT